MYQRAVTFRLAECVLDAPAATSTGAAARLALGRVRKALTAYAPGMPLEPGRLRRLIASAPAESGQEAERTLALGFLHWLDGDPAAAEPVLAEAVTLARKVEGSPLLAEAAYWLGRVRVLLGRADAVSEFEAVLKSLRGAPQATAWFVDLLWRSGRIDRADQVWKSVRANKRVTACDEGPLLEARSLLRRGEAAPAERVLNEAAPANGVAWVERHLLLAWTLTTLKQYDRARAALDSCWQGPYPAGALSCWRVLLDRRLGEPAAPEDAGRTPAVLAALFRGHQALQEGRAGDAEAAFGEALQHAAAQPFARYGLACLGKDDPAAVLTQQPGLFLALRCRAWAALDRFRRRQATPAELLDALQQAGSAGWTNPTAEHYRRLALALQQRQPGVEEVRALAAEPAADDAVRHNLLRAALELAVRRLAPPAALGLLLEWSGLDWLPTDADVRPLVGRQLLRLVLLRRGEPAGDAPPTDAAAVAVEKLLPGDPLAALLREWLLTGSPTDTTAFGADAPSVVRLWRAGRALAQGIAAGEEERWREEVRGLRAPGRMRAPAQALLLVEAARRGDAATVAALLDEVDHWRGFRPAPPRFVTDAVAAVVASQPNLPAWKRSLPRWLQVWGAAALGAAGATLAAQAGLAPASAGGAAEPPAGTPAVPWFLHQAARALGRDDAEALAYLRRALAADPELTGVADAAVVREALPELERRARAQALASAARPNDDAAAVPAALLADAVELLAALPDGPALLDAAGRGDRAAVRAGLAALADRPDLPPRLAQHLALIEQRAAQSLEEREQFAAAEPCWRGAWRFWTRFLAAPEAPPGADAAQSRAAVLDHLLGIHRGRVADLLARNALEDARRHWTLVRELPALAARADEALGRDLTERVARFREDLATEYLVATREAMRYGTIPEGWRADYDKGLSLLRRLLSLEGDDARLLTALVEICDEWFLDLYNAEDRSRMTEQVDRYTPFATQLARLAAERPGDLAARASLADFYKFRGFTARDRAHKVELYREALRFDPTNENVRGLLKDLGEAVDPPAAPPPDVKTEDKP